MTRLPLEPNAQFMKMCGTGSTATSAPPMPPGREYPRVGEVARPMAEAGLIVICSFISPFRAERRTVGELIGPIAFFEIFVDTPIDECIRRDTKGLYAKAKAGRIENFTGLDSGYEAPDAPEIRVATVGVTAEAAAEYILDELRRREII